MNLGLYGAFVFTVVLLVTTTYFILGGLPLLILKHDVPLDARFVRAFFNVYYRAAFWAALGAAASFALWGRPVFAAGAAAIAALVTGLKRWLLPAMDQIGEQIAANDTSAVERFRRMHGAALLINAAQLVVLVWGVFQLSRSMMQRSLRPITRLPRLRHRLPRPPAAKRP